MLFQYSCKKTGQLVDVNVDALPPASRDYAIRRGLREYFDNYHASETLKSHNGDSAKLAAAVRPLVTEAHTRIMAGDVPGERGTIDSHAMVLAKLTTMIGRQATDADLESFVAHINKTTKKAA